ncbi:quinol monooxygenase YgiN [Streptosporangium becharense]|uniref:Quinol monooxygenase YgiN n=1 Tax=Streptosporangium becharense TaxID=1816182 RepID=A0A7W9INB7_9ACTN|nr:antibiotic biosynthesis monooxygenase family protein [Streptosporangium becharense]MBB2910436.1 quinol monooxygenase YgiN [Streptosporangium becharense]MBB5823179.1 quinol monooxygenase YgiN [Streptosporangium becharense]
MVVFVNKLTLVGSAEEFEAIYADIAAFMMKQDGLIRYKLVRSTKDASVYFNLAEWESREQFEKSVADPEFRAQFKRLAGVVTGDPHLSEVVLEGSPSVV